MKYLRIILLHFEQVFEHRLRAAVWFLIPFLNALMLIIFWSGASKNNSDLQTWTRDSLITYYLILAFANSFLIAHIEEDVSYLDIWQGDLVRYLVKPVSYFFIKLIEETPYRILQGSYGILIFLIVEIFFKWHMQVVNNIYGILIALIIAILGYFLSFTFKMCLGLLTFWLMEIRAVMEVVDAFTIIFAGMIIPLSLYPHFLRDTTYILPFSYMIYFPVLAFLGKLNSLEIYRVVSGQCAWILFFLLLYKFEWKKGLKTFTAVGQ